MLARMVKVSLGPMMALVLGGCATYASPRQSYAYFVVPCSIPGAFPAEPAIEVPDAGVPQAAARADSPLPSAEATTTGPPPTCLIAAAVSRPGVRPSYGGSGYYDPYYYGRYGYPFYGSIGIGLHGGGHRGGGYGGHGLGHGGGRHVGGGHGGH